MNIARQNSAIETDLASKIKTIMFERGVSLLQARIIMVDLIDNAVVDVRKELG